LKWNKIVLLTGYDRFFGQTRKPWVSMNVDRMLPILRQNGYEVEEYEFHQIANRQVEIRNAVVLYTFSQRANLRRYIQDVVRFLDEGSNLLLPSYDLLRCHENKGYQELFRPKVGLERPRGYYFSSKREIRSYDLRYPLVLKAIEGSNAKGVSLVHNDAELKQKIRSWEPGTGIWTRLGFFRRKYLRRKKYYAEYPDYNNRIDYSQYRDYITPETGFILQEYVSELDHDYRISVFGDRYYVVKRMTRENDFRASGAKRFIVDFQIDPEMLDFAKEVYSRFKTPWLSIDIAQKNGQFYIFEYQALHFGINAIVKNRGFYRSENGDWQFIPGIHPIEEEIADGLIKFLQRQEA